MRYDMAIDIKTLRIGSHVQHHGKRKMVLSMGGDTVYLLPSIVSSVAHVAKTDEIHPIPITPGLLKELGFNKGMSSAVGFDSWYCDMMRIDNNVMQAHPWWFYNQVKLKYLHELESLYYMIYGVELIKE